MDKTELYKNAGVDISKGDRLVGWMKTNDSPSNDMKGEVVAGIGGFTSLFRPNLSSYSDPLLTAATDGVGTKVLLGIDWNSLEGLGVDLVAMCANDLYTIGGKPLFFLDYYATGKLEESQFKSVLLGIKKGCHQAGASLIGGETAEMPGLYETGHFDLAGFMVGIVDGKKTLGPHRVTKNSVIYGIKSNGFHSNGYSLLRQWLKKHSDLERYKKEIMRPTRIYHEIPELLEKVGIGGVQAISHITGGGVEGNVARILPDGLCAYVDKASFPTAEWMKSIISKECEDLFSMSAVFNLGVGVVLIVDRTSSDEFESAASEMELPYFPMGEVKSNSSSKVLLC